MTCNFMSKDLSGKFLIIKLLDHFKQSATGALKTSLKRVIQKVVEATDNVISNKIVNKITRNSPQNNSETDSQTEKNWIEIPENISQVKVMWLWLGIYTCEENYKNFQRTSSC